MNKRPLMLTRYEVETLIKAIANWNGVEGRRPEEIAAATRLYKALSELKALMQYEMWEKERIRL